MSDIMPPPMEDIMGPFMNGQISSLNLAPTVDTVNKLDAFWEGFWFGAGIITAITIGTLGAILIVEIIMQMTGGNDNGGN